MSTAETLINKTEGIVDRAETVLKQAENAVRHAEGTVVQAQSIVKAAEVILRQAENTVVNAERKMKKIPECQKWEVSERDRFVPELDIFGLSPGGEKSLRIVLAELC